MIEFLLAAGGLAAAATAGIAARAVVRRRRVEVAEGSRYTHAAQISASVVRIPGPRGAGSSVDVLRVSNAGSAILHAVTLIVHDPAGERHVQPGLHTLPAGGELLLPVPEGAGTDAHRIVVRFTDGELVTWQLDVTSGTVREMQSVVAQR